MSDNNVIRKLQNAELMILKDIADICNKNKLKYYLIGGTLLGAVRHKGFIPWDDDIDLVMFRNDYDELFRLLTEKYNEKYFVQRFETDRNYTRYIMKIRLNGTKHIEDRVSGVEMNHGIYIDIFPIDYLKNSGMCTHIRGGALRTLFAIKNIKHVKTGYNGIKGIVSKIVLPFIKLIPDSFINTMFDKICTMDNHKECSYVTNFASHFKWKKQMYPTEYFGEGTELLFEDAYFCVPNQYEKILTRLYGDYMQLPPKEKRTAHNIVEVDFGKYNELV